MISIPSKNYYKNHFRILKRYQHDNNTLHIVGNNNLKFKDLPNVKFLNQEVSLDSQLTKSKKFKTIIFSDFFESSNDIYSLLSELKNYVQPNGKIIISVVNYKYSWLIKLLELFNLKKKSPKLSHIQESNIKNLAEATGFQFISSHTKQILPFKFFGIFSLINNILEMILSKFNLGINKYIILKNVDKKNQEKLKRTVIIPAKNEEGNIPILFEKLKNIDIDEIVFSVGLSKDKTLEVVKNIKNSKPKSQIKIHEQSKNGKANAIWESFDKVTGDVVAILDSDISVDPEELPKFFSIIENDYADFVNGTRLIYPMEKNSMRKINLIGNRAFQAIVSFIIGIKLSDSLCGTKVFKKDFISKVSWWQDEYSLFDPFCDFDLLFTASYVGEKIVEYPIHYKSRIYGKTQISRFRDGFKLIVYLIKSYKIFNTSI